MNKSKQYKRIEWMIIFVLLLIATGIQTASANTLVQYRCCNNFTTNNGTMIEEFTDATQWSGNGVNTTNDLSVFRPGGTRSISINASAGTAANTTKTVALDLSNGDIFSIWLYARDPQNISTVSYNFASDAAFANYYTKTITYDLSGQKTLNKGWNHIVGKKSTAVATGAPNWAAIIRLKIVLTPVATKTANISLQNLSLGYLAKPKAIITFDDGFLNVSTKALPILQSNNQNATSFVVTNMTSLANHMNLSEMRKLQDAGWDVSSHTADHIDLVSGVSSAFTAKMEMDNSYSYLVNNGFAKSAPIIAYPFGDYNDSVLVNASINYVLGRSTNSDIFQPDYLEDDGNITLQIKTEPIQATVTGAGINVIIENAIGRNGTTVFVFHDILDSGATGGTQYNKTDFQNFSNYLAGNTSRIDVITMSDLLFPVITSYTPILNKAVNISPSGTVKILSRNMYDEYMVNMLAVPTTDNLTVNVTTWNTAGDYHKTFIASSITHNNPTTFTIGDFPANTNIQVNKNGVFSNTYLSNNLGYISITQNTYSDVIIDAFITSNLPTTALELQTCPSVNSDINAAFMLIGVLLMVFAAGMLISGIRSMNYPFMIIGIAAIIVGSVMVIVGYFITVTISNGVGCLG